VVAACQSRFQVHDRNSMDVLEEIEKRDMPRIPGQLNVLAVEGLAEDSPSHHAQELAL
jgi:hypothetical protein